MRHATDPDHVIAVSTIVARERSATGAAAVGAACGVGHTIAILIVGGGIIAFGWVIPPHIGLSMEFSVAVVLVVLGVMNLLGAVSTLRENLTTKELARPMAGDHVHVHSHAHAHGDYVHTHPHGHEPDVHPHAASQTPLGRLDRRFGRQRAYQLLRPLIVGVVHGLAGSAAIALLVLTVIHNASWGIFYLLVFGLGTTAGMMLLTLVIVIPFARRQERMALWNGRLRVASGVVAVVFGLFVAYQALIGSGLAAGHPVWIQR